MRNFHQIGAGMNVSGLMLALVRSEDLWNRHKVRTSHDLTAHRQVDDIILRYNAFQQGDDFVDKVCSRIGVVNYAPWLALPHARAMVMQLMVLTEGVHLGRVFISRMKPGAVIPPHTDRIEEAELQYPSRIRPWEYYNRYHICLKAQPGVVFRCGDEFAEMRPGELWWFNNRIEHEVQNNSADDRIHLIADIHSGGEIFEPRPWTTPH